MHQCSEKHQRYLLVQSRNQLLLVILPCGNETRVLEASFIHSILLFVKKSCFYLNWTEHEAYTR